MMLLVTCCMSQAQAHCSTRLCMMLQVQLLLDWASMGGFEWSVSVAGPRGITPLHLAALLPDHGAIAKLLTGGQPPWDLHAVWTACNLLRLSKTVSLQHLV